MNKFICSIEFCTSYFNLSNKRRVLQGVWRALLNWIKKLSITGLPEHRSAKTRGLMIHPNNYSLWTQQLIQFNSNFWPPKEKLTKQISVHSIKYLYVPDLSVYTLCAKIEILAAKSGPDKMRLSVWGPCLPKKGMSAQPICQLQTEFLVLCRFMWCSNAIYCGSTGHYWLQSVVQNYANLKKKKWISFSRPQLSIWWQGSTWWCDVRNFLASTSAWHDNINQNHSSKR